MTDCHLDFNTSINKNIHATWPLQIIMNNYKGSHCLNYKKIIFINNTEGNQLL